MPAVGELKILSTPQPADQRPVRTAIAPASAILSGAPGPMARVDIENACLASSLALFISWKDSGVAWSNHDWSSRQVGSANEIATIRPSTSGNHASNSSEFVNRGGTITSPSIGPSVPGLQARIIPSSVRWRGATRSRCV